jgi:hypothetical protein
LNRNFQLWFLKLLVNLPVRFLDRFLKFPQKAEFPQTRMLLNTYGQMMVVYRVDCLQGVFGAVPDKNLERLIRVGAKVLVGVSESDRYYRAWVGLAYLLAKEEYLRNLQQATPQSLVFDIKRQWLSDLSFLNEKQIMYDLEGFYQYSITNYLSNLVHNYAQITTTKNIGGICKK